MKHTVRNAGFSLMEVNMAVFVMAIGILGMVALFPLGLREGVQARQDLKQAMFADHAINQIVAILSQTNMTWSVWKNLHGIEGHIGDLQSRLPSELMPVIYTPDEREMQIDFDRTIRENWTVGVDGTELNNNHFHITCAIPDDSPSACILGITVRATDSNDPYPGSERERKAWKNRYPPYYTEVLFNGDPTK